MTNPIPALAADPAGVADRIASLPDVPGVAVAGITSDGVEVAGSGVRDIETMEPVDPTTRFRPGSITKLLTATLVMQLVDEGRVGLESRIIDLVPEFRPADPERASRVTVRHLLDHSSGIDAGDLFIDTGDGDDCLERYIEAMARTGFLFEPGHTFSYCNAGTVLAGRIVQLLRGASWEDALREHVLDPLGMTSTTFVPGKHAGEPPAVAGAARGHVVGSDGLAALPWRLDETYTCRGLAPPGGTLVSTAGDLARLVLAHIGSSLVPAILSAAAAARMRELAAPAPGGVRQMLGVGLGWQVWHGSVRAAGANPGQSGVVALDAERGSALVVLTNSDTGVNATHPVLDAGMPPLEPEPLLPLECYTGDYESHVGRFRVSIGADQLRVRLVGWDAAGDAPLTPADGMTFASPAGPVAFFDRGEDGRPQLLRWRMRVSRRVA